MKQETNILPVTINDLREKYFSGEQLTPEEKLALSNFDHYRVERLSKLSAESEFRSLYLKIQAMANLSSYHYFLNMDLLDNVSLS